LYHNKRSSPKVVDGVEPSESVAHFLVQTVPAMNQTPSNLVDSAWPAFH
jgi:hypothetical protein